MKETEELVVMPRPFDGAAGRVELLSVAVEKLVKFQIWKGKDQEYDLGVSLEGCLDIRMDASCRQVGT